MSKSKMTKSLIVSATLLLTACGSSSSSTSSSNLTPDSSSGVNKAPIVDAGEDRKAQVNTSVLIWGSASDSDGQISLYEWKKGDNILGTTADLRYTPTKLGTEILTFRVVDNDGVSASDTLNLEVITEVVEDRYNRPLPFY